VKQFLYGLLHLWSIASSVEHFRGVVNPQIGRERASRVFAMVAKLTACSSRESVVAMRQLGMAAASFLIQPWP